MSALKSVRLKMSFADLLGQKESSMPEAIRKERWNHWQQLAIKAGHKDTVDYWLDCSETCAGCVNLIERESWCEACGLPATVNPILSYGSAMRGMACRGVGYQAKEPQLTLFES